MQVLTLTSQPSSISNQCHFSNFWPSYPYKLDKSPVIHVNTFVLSCQSRSVNPKYEFQKDSFGKIV